MENKSSKFNLHSIKARNLSMLSIGETQNDIQHTIIEEAMKGNTSIMLNLRHEEVVELRKAMYSVSETSVINNIYSQCKVSW